MQVYRIIFGNDAYVHQGKRNVYHTLSPGKSPDGKRVTGGAAVNIGGTSWTSWTITTTSKPAIFLESCPGSAYASYTLKKIYVLKTIWYKYYGHQEKVKIEKLYLICPASSTHTHSHTPQCSLSFS